MITGSVCNEILKLVQSHDQVEKFKNSFINLALPQFVMSQPDQPRRNESKDYDPIMCGPVKCIPEGYTCYEKVVINAGSLSLQALIEWFDTNLGLEITMITTGNIALYNAYLPNNKHASRLPMKVEDIFREMSDLGLPGGRYYLILEVGGSIKDTEEDFQIPPIKYCFKPAP